MTDEQFAKIMKKLEAIHETAYAGVPASRRSRRARTGEAPDIKTIRQHREEELLRLFYMVVHQPREKKLKQTINPGLVEPAVPKNSASWEMLPRSILRNRASMRKAFNPVVDQGEKSAEANVDAVLDELLRRKELFQVPMKEATARSKYSITLSNTPVIVSPAEYALVLNREEEIEHVLEPGETPKNSMPFPLIFDADKEYEPREMAPGYADAVDDTQKADQSGFNMAPRGDDLPKRQTKKEREEEAEYYARRDAAAAAADKAEQEAIDARFLRQEEKPETPWTLKK